MDSLVRHNGIIATGRGWGATAGLVTGVGVGLAAAFKATAATIVGTTLTGLAAAAAPWLAGAAILTAIYLWRNSDKNSNPRRLALGIATVAALSLLPGLQMVPFFYAPLAILASGCGGIGTGAFLGAGAGKGRVWFEKRIKQYLDSRP